MDSRTLLRRIVSGGQTGPDRAALDVAMVRGVPVGGWCPAGRWAEDGLIPERYPLVETPEADPSERTRRNVRDSDATLILSPKPLWGGTSLTHRIALDIDRPVFVADPFHDDIERAATWIETTLGEDGVLNVAGPRESQVPGIQSASAVWFGRLLDRLPDDAP